MNSDSRNVSTKVSGHVEINMGSFIHYVYAMFFIQVFLLA